MTKNSTEIYHPLIDIHIVPMTDTKAYLWIIPMTKTSADLCIIPMTGTRMNTEIDHLMTDI